MNSKMVHLIQMPLLPKGNGREGEFSSGNTGCNVFYGLLVFSSCSEIPPLLTHPMNSRCGFQERGRKLVRMEGKEKSRKIELNLESFSKYVSICALCSPLLPFPLEQENNSALWTSSQF